MNSNLSTNILLTVIAVTLIVILICACLINGIDVVDPDPTDPVFHFQADLTGFEEVPPVIDTKTTGKLLIRINEDSTGFFFQLTVDSADGLLSGGAHLHCAPIGRTGEIFVSLSKDILPDGLDGNFQISDDRNKFDIINDVCGDDIKQLIESMNRGGVYVNAHSKDYPTGEIRGQVTPVPDPPS